MLEGDVEIYENLYNVKRKLYKNLTAKHINDTMLKNKIDEYEKLICDRKLTMGECIQGIQKMKFYKSTGFDCLTAEIYKQFWNKLKVLVLNTGYER